MGFDTWLNAVEAKLLDHFGKEMFIPDTWFPDEFNAGKTIEQCVADCIERVEWAWNYM